MSDLSEVLAVVGLSELPSRHSARSFLCGTLACSQSGTLALFDHGGNWCLLDDGESRPADSTGGSGAPDYALCALVLDVPADVRRAIRVEPNNVRRVEIALAAGRPAVSSLPMPSLWTGGEVQWADLPRGSGRDFAHVGTSRELRHSDYPTNGSKLPIVVGLSDEQCDAIARASRNDKEKLARSFVFDASTAVSVQTPTIDDVLQEQLAELATGLCTNISDRPPKDMTFLLRSESEWRPFLASVGIVETLHTTRDGSRGDIVTDLRGWPAAGVEQTAGRGGTSLGECNAHARVERLLSATRERRMLAHLYDHHGLIARLRSWSEKRLPAEVHVPDAEAVRHIWGGRLFPWNRRDVAAMLGLRCDSDDKLQCFGWGNEWMTLCNVTVNGDAAHCVGHLLRAAKAALGEKASCKGDVLDYRWLCESGDYIDYEIPSRLDPLLRSLADGNYAARLVRPLWRDEVSVQAPLSLRVHSTHVPTLFVDLRTQLGPIYARRAVQSALLREGRDSFEKVVVCQMRMAGIEHMYGAQPVRGPGSGSTQ